MTDWGEGTLTLGDTLAPQPGDTVGTRSVQHFKHDFHEGVADLWNTAANVPMLMRLASRDIGLGQQMRRLKREVEEGLISPDQAKAELHAWLGPESVAQPLTQAESYLRTEAQGEQKAAGAKPSYSADFLPRTAEKLSGLVGSTIPFMGKYAASFGAGLGNPVVGMGVLGALGGANEGNDPSDLIQNDASWKGAARKGGTEALGIGVLRGIGRVPMPARAPLGAAVGAGYGWEKGETDPAGLTADAIGFGLGSRLTVPGARTRSGEIGVMPGGAPRPSVGPTPQLPITPVSDRTYVVRIGKRYYVVPAQLGPRSLSQDEAVQEAVQGLRRGKSYPGFDTSEEAERVAQEGR